MQFRRLDVGLDSRGRPVATVAECRNHSCARWLSVALRSGHRWPLHVTAPAGCSIQSVARWRSRTALGVNCGAHNRIAVVVRGPHGVSQEKFPKYLGAQTGGAWVDIRGDLVSADFDWDGFDWIWALRTDAHPCRRHLDVAGSEGDTNANAGRAHIVSGDRLLWSHLHSEFEGGQLAPGEIWDTLASVGPRCQTAKRYIPSGLWSNSMTLIGSWCAPATDTSPANRSRLSRRRSGQ